MNKKLINSALAVMLAAVPLSATAGMGADENINIYAWQNWSLEFVDINEMVAQWIDPYYDADVTSHSNLMGNLGATASPNDGAGYYVGGFESRRC